MKITIEITNCKDCPFNKSHYGHGENWNFCSHMKAPNGYGKILPYNKNEIPKWCPLGIKD